MSEFLWVEKYRPKTIEECILPESTKETFTEFVKNGEKIGTINIKHVSINPITREKCALSKQINLWLNESSLNF